MNRPVNVQRAFDGVAISKNGSATSVAIELTYTAPMGLFSAFILEQAGALSDVTFTYSLCNTKDGTYIFPTGASAIKANHIGTSTDVVSFDPDVSKFMKITATENNVAAVTSLTVDIAFQ